MVKKIDILGMQVDNYTVRESLLRLDTYMCNTALNVIETVTMKQLMAAGENPVIRECLEQADLCVIGEREILSETGNATMQRVREVREQDFMRELIKRVVRNQKRVFLIAMTGTELENMQEFFKGINAKFNVAGSYAMEACAGDTDAIVNEINGATPDMIISALESPVEEEFVLTHREKMGAGVWYGIGTGYNKKRGHMQVGTVLRKLALRGRLHRSMSEYQNEK